MPELHSFPIQTNIQLLAEFLTAFTLILAGYSLLAERWWGPKVYLVSLGMLVYAAVQASAYYAQKSEFLMVVMFTVIIIFGLAVTRRY
jgi:Na+/melibiose symporter-like transporter